MAHYDGFRESEDALWAAAQERKREAKKAKAYLARQPEVVFTVVPGKVTLYHATVTVYVTALDRLYVHTNERQAFDYSDAIDRAMREVDTQILRDLLERREREEDTQVSGRRK